MAGVAIGSAPGGRTEQSPDSGLLAIRPAGVFSCKTQSTNGCEEFTKPPRRNARLSDSHLLLSS
jgi:hypothetical protein